MIKKAAFVAVIGRPSVGKSTLVNKLCGEKVSIVSTVPQTTRNAIRGIVNREQGQLVFVDTPGRHKSEKKFNKKLTEVSGRAVADSDIVLYVVDAARAPGPEEADIVSLLIPYVDKTVIAVNKIDADGADCDRIRKFLEENLTGLSEDRLFTISALNGEGVEELLSTLYDISPEGEPLYGEEYYTDQDVNFRIAEIIREQAINRLREELPHALYVEVADAQFSELGIRGEEGIGDRGSPAALSAGIGERCSNDDTASGLHSDTSNKNSPVPSPQSLPIAPQAIPTLWIRAFIIVERESQKGMVVGKGGMMIRDIRLAALKELRKIFDWKIELDLRVKTGKDWRHNDRVLKKLVK